MSAIKSIFWFIASARLLPLGIVSLLSILFVVLSYVSFDTYTSWKTESQYFDRWSRTDQPRECHQIELTCEKLVKEKHPSSDQIKASSDPYGQLLAKDKCVRDEASKQAALSCSVREPGDFSTALKESLFSNPLIEQSFLIWTCFLVGVLALKSTFEEQHPGWRRLTLVAALIAATVIYAFVTQTRSYSIFQQVFIAVAALIFSALTIVYVRRVVLWVQAGFRYESVQTSEEQEPIKGSEESELKSLENPNI